MSISKRRFFHNRIFQTGELSEVFEKIIKEYTKEPVEIEFKLSEELSDGSSSHSTVTYQELGSICDLNKSSIETSFYSEDKTHIYITLHGYGDCFAINISCDNSKILNKIFEKIFVILELIEVPSPLESIPRKSDLLKRIESIENAIYPQSKNLRCFLSYRFNENTEIIALKLQQFLRLLDVNVITCASYEPRRISEKVISKLEGPLDFIILLITFDGETMWTRDEISSALHRDLAVVPVVEEGAKFVPGLFGDLEYIQFSKGHIGDAFLKLLEAIYFIRNEKIENKKSNDKNEKEKDETK